MVCVEGRQCVQEGWQGEEPNQIKAIYIVHVRAAVNQINNHMYT